MLINILSFIWRINFMLTIIKHKNKYHNLKPWFQIPKTCHIMSYPFSSEESEYGRLRPPKRCTEVSVQVPLAPVSPAGSQ